MSKNRRAILGVLLFALLAIGIIFLLRSSRSTSERMPGSFVSGSGSEQILYPVDRVIDGDTIDVSIDGKTERIRFIGIDTPETVDDRKKIQCYGPESSARMKALLTGASVSLEQKPDEDRDDYGRLLRYVFLEGRDIGAMLLYEGYARSLCFAFPHPKCSEYDRLERIARDGRRGRWGVCK
ncbi:thermonuclease family protein [Candidatus Peribacteria bacterium]|nr:thermonuclease family protein [Candidatus Peribacteria bacterium]